MFCFLVSHAINLWNLSSRTFCYRYWTLRWTATWLQNHSETHTTEPCNTLYASCIAPKRRLMAFEKNIGLLVHPDSYYWNLRNKHSLKVCKIWDNLPNLFPLNINDILWFFIVIGCDLWNRQGPHFESLPKAIPNKKRFFRTRLFPWSYFYAFFFSCTLKGFYGDALMDPIAPMAILSTLSCATLLNH